jgi:hypothetical protein
LIGEAPTKPFQTIIADKTINQPTTLLVTFERVEQSGEIQEQNFFILFHNSVNSVASDVWSLFIFISVLIQIMAETEQMVSKNAAKKAEKEKEKAAKKAEFAEKKAATGDSGTVSNSTDAEDISKDFYGDLPLIQSKEKVTRDLGKVKDLTGK